MKREKSSGSQKEERNVRSLSELKAIVENAEVPLPKLSKSERQELLGWFKRSQPDLSALSSSIALRYHLILGSSIPVSFLTSATMASALLAEDLLKYSSKLVPKIRVHLLNPYLTALRTAIERSGSQVSRVTALSIKNRTKFFLLGIAGHNDLDFRVEEVELNELIRAVVTRLNIKREKDRSIGEMLAKEFFSIALLSLQASSPHNVFVSGLKLMRALSSYFGSGVLERLFDEFTDERQYDLMKVGFARRINEYAERAAAKELKELLGYTKDLSPFGEAAVNQLKELGGKDAARLHPSVQEMIRAELGIELEAKRQSIAFVDESERTEVALLASILLKCWDAKEEGPKASLAFSVVSDIATRIFYLRLGGSVGTEVAFDPNLHEWFDEGRSERVRIIRPWVEWNNKGSWRVLVKALVLARGSS